MITITKEQFNQLNRTMYRCFNFILAVEDMDIPQVNDLQATPKEYNISMTSVELMKAFKDIFISRIEKST